MLLFLKNCISIDKSGKYTKSQGCKVDWAARDAPWVTLPFMAVEQSTNYWRSEDLLDLLTTYTKENNDVRKLKWFS